MSGARSAEILRLLVAGDVEFVVVGMAAGVLQGAPVSTLDLDIVYRGTPENVKRLLAAKDRAGRPKDLAALPALRATLKEDERRS
jgi:hypothetical protein